MKFSEFKYERIDIEKTKEELTKILDKLEKEENPEKFNKIYGELEKLENHIQTMATLSSIRHSIDTKDEFYKEENDFWDNNIPLLEECFNRESKILLAFKDKEKLYKYIPEVIFKQLELTSKTFSPEIIPLLQKENIYASKYGELKAGAQLNVDGKTYNLSTISKLTTSLLEEERKKGYDAIYKFYSEHEAEFDDIYDNLVSIRTEIAHKLGFKDFVELAYCRMTRIDYDKKMVENYRKQIVEELVPLDQELYAKQAKRINKETLAYYNENINFLSGNPKPKGNKDELVDKAVKMYHELSDETGKFIDIMNEQELWDLDSKDGKQMGGYCTSIEEYGVPFIFANFNGSSHDVDVLTHEAGHAFQYYSARDIKPSAAKWPTMESCEIHSMSMEFLTHPWMESFFKEDYEKYYYHHVASALKFLPYGALVDHFQHEIYEHPQMSKDERKATWRKLEKMYCPHKNYAGCEILEKGCYWYQQGHIFENPFYYIDYCLAQVCALQFFKKMSEDKEKALKDYMHLCKLGGTLSFLGLVKQANLKSPFEDGTVKEICDFAKKYLDSIDDSKL